MCASGSDARAFTGVHQPRQRPPAQAAQQPHRRRGEEPCHHRRPAPSARASPRRRRPAGWRRERWARRRRMHAGSGAPPSPVRPGSPPGRRRSQPQPARAGDGPAAAPARSWMGRARSRMPRVAPDRELKAQIEQQAPARGQEQGGGGAEGIQGIPLAAQDLPGQHQHGHETGPQDRGAGAGEEDEEGHRRKGQGRGGGAPQPCPVKEPDAAGAPSWRRCRRSRPAGGRRPSPGRRRDVCGQAGPASEQQAGHQCRFPLGQGLVEHPLQPQPGATAARRNGSSLPGPSRCTGPDSITR